MALSIVEGFVFYARKIDQLGKKSHKAFDRINARCAAMKMPLGEMDLNTDHIHILNKNDKVQSILDKYSTDGQLDVMEYTNAVIMMVNKMQDNIPNRDIQKEWGTLEGMMFTLYSHMEEIDKVEFVQQANEMGTEMTLAVLS